MRDRLGGAAAQGDTSCLISGSCRFATSSMVEVAAPEPFVAS
jgi:hypothetical protein